MNFIKKIENLEEIKNLKNLKIKWNPIYDMGNLYELQLDSLEII